jgi:hypothetical protein
MKVALGAALAVATLQAAAAHAEPLLWRISGPRATVTLVGTTPVAPVDGKWKIPALQQAAAGAEEVWFATPFGLPGPFTALRMLATMQTKGYLPAGQRLSPMLSAEGRARLSRLATRFGLNLDRLDRMTPWNAEINVQLAAKKRDGAMQGSPVERYVLSLAPRSISKRALDNLEDDLKYLISTPQTEQIYDLEVAMRRDEEPSINEKYGEAWADGDQAYIEREREDLLRTNAPVTYRILQVEPRQRWAIQIAKLAAGSKNVMVVVDAANLVGQNGLPTLLRKRGLTVEGP